MSRILNITNGDCAASLMQKAGVAGDILPWRDVLHEGPVPGGLELQQLSRIRADFIAGRGWGEGVKIRKDFIRRDQSLERAADFAILRLWFEHDLYDQLQILQILHWLYHHPLPDTVLELICTEQYLGELSVTQVAALSDHVQLINAQQLALANVAWQAFGEDTPDAFAALHDADTTALPYLHDAVVRIIEEYPDRKTGLGKTEHRVLWLLDQSPMSPGELFAANQSAETRVYLGDLGYWNLLNELLVAPEALITVNRGQTPVTAQNLDQTLALTDIGAALLQGKHCRADNGFPDRWIGGVRLTVDNWRRYDWSPQRLLS